MRHDIYEAMKARIKDVGRVYVDSDINYVAPGGWTHYRFFNDGLNDGLRDCDEDYIDAIVQAMQTRNMWNVCQRFYGFLRRWYNDFDGRLLANTPKVSL